MAKADSRIIVADTRPGSNAASTMMADDGIPLKEASFGPVTLGSTEGRMIAVDEGRSAAFLYVDEAGLLNVVPWSEALRRFGPVKRDT